MDRELEKFVEDQIDDDLEKYEKMLKPNPVKEKLIIVGIVILGIAIFFGVVFGSLYLAHEASSAVIQGFGLPPIK